MELKDVLDAIGEANDLEMTEIVKAVIRRDDARYPQQETLFLSVPRERGEQRRRILEAMVELMMRENG